MIVVRKRAMFQLYHWWERVTCTFNASTVWDPHTQANINKVESIQRRAARFVTNNLEPVLQHYYKTSTGPPYNTDWPRLAHPTTQTPTSQTHHDVLHYLPSHRNTIYYLSHPIQIRYQRTQHPIPTTFNQSASISILLLPQHHPTLEQPTTDPSQLRLHWHLQS
jgi:hypothetical protein